METKNGVRSRGRRTGVWICPPTDEIEATKFPAVFVRCAARYNHSMGTTMRKYSRIVLAAISGFAFSPTHALPSLINGDFSAVVPTNGTGGGWTTSNLDGSGGWLPTGGSFDAHFILNQAGQALTDPTLEQLIGGFVIGQQYTIVGQFESVFSGFGNPDAFSFGVEIVELAGSLVEYQRPDGVGTFSMSFVAAAEAHTLRLTGERNGDDSSYRVDNVQIIPLPASVWLLATAMLAVFGRWRRPVA